MKQAALYFACDNIECNESTAPDSTWEWARKNALDAGWWLGRFGSALCPECRP